MKRPERYLIRKNKMNPYDVLGVDPSASDEEIKKVYRELVKKYHPDRYTDSKLKEEAAEKIKEINAAYAEIERIRSGKGSSSGTYGRRYDYSGFYTSGSNPRYNAVRLKINQGDITGAEALLMQFQDRDAEWYYLEGVICLRKGWQDGARENFTKAYNMDPTNREFAQAYTMMNEFGGFKNFYGNSSNDCGMCDFCTSLLIIDLCCGNNRCC